MSLNLLVVRLCANPSECNQSLSGVLLSTKSTRSFPRTHFGSHGQRIAHEYDRRTFGQPLLWPANSCRRAVPTTKCADARTPLWTNPLGARWRCNSIRCKCQYHAIRYDRKSRNALVFDALPNRLNNGTQKDNILVTLTEFCDDIEMFMYSDRLRWWDSYVRPIECPPWTRCASYIPAYRPFHWLQSNQWDSTEPLAIAPGNWLAFSVSGTTQYRIEIVMRQMPFEMAIMSNNFFLTSRSAKTRCIKNFRALFNSIGSNNLTERKKFYQYREQVSCWC